MRISDWSSDVCSSDLPRIVGGQRAEGYGRPGVGQRDHPLRQFKDGDLVRIAEIDRADHRGGRLHQPDQSLNEVVDIAKGSRLRAVAVDSSVESRVGKECVSTCRSRWSTEN